MKRVEILNQYDATGTDTTTEHIATHTTRGQASFGDDFNVVSGHVSLKQSNKTMVRQFVMTKAAADNNGTDVYTLDNLDDIDDKISNMTFFVGVFDTASTDGSKVAFNLNGLTHAVTIPDEGLKADTPYYITALKVSEDSYGNQLFNFYVTGYISLLESNKITGDVTFYGQVNIANEHIVRKGGTIDYTYTLPAESGTIALTSDISKCYRHNLTFSLSVTESDGTTSTYSIKVIAQLISCSGDAITKDTLQTVLGLEVSDGAVYPIGTVGYSSYTIDSVGTDTTDTAGEQSQITQLYYKSTSTAMNIYGRQVDGTEIALDGADLTDFVTEV